MILQRISIIVEDAGSYPGPLPQKSGSLPMSHNISNLDIAGDLLLLLVPEGDVYDHALAVPWYCWRSPSSPCPRGCCRWPCTGTLILLEISFFSLSPRVMSMAMFLDTSSITFPKVSTSWLLRTIQRIRIFPDNNVEGERWRKSKKLLSPQR